MKTPRAIQQLLTRHRQLLGQLSVKGKLLLAMGTVLGMLGGAAGLSYTALQSVQRGMKNSLVLNEQVLKSSEKMRESVREVYSNVLLASLAQTKEDIQYYSEQVKVARQHYNQAKAALIEACSANGAQPNSETLKTVSANEDSVSLQASSALKQRLDTAHRVDASQTIAMDTDQILFITSALKDMSDYWAKSVDSIVVDATKISQANLARSEDSAQFARQMLIGATCLSLLIGILGTLSISGSISTPLGHAVQVAEQIAGGDLSNRIKMLSTDETGTLLKALTRMQSSLQHIVGDVRGSAQAIESASKEVAAGNFDLSQRTDNTASQLQYTSSSLHQLKQLVEQSHFAAEQAIQTSRSAGSAATQGGESVRNVIRSMNRISDQSAKISEIISVIDSIAFQTNILALNAAVEAARAGDQGRGFAVVASEVRTLAQRSAKAARDIKDLIVDTVAAVQSGVESVHCAQQSMSAIVSSSEEVNSTVEAISQSAHAQVSGISELSKAMTLLDNMTQQNAALVEQGAAAADSLNSQAQRLSELMASFKLDA